QAGPRRLAGGRRGLLPARGMEERVVRLLLRAPPRGGQHHVADDAAPDGGDAARGRGEPLPPSAGQSGIREDPQRALLILLPGRSWYPSLGAQRRFDNPSAGG